MLRPSRLNGGTMAQSFSRAENPSSASRILCLGISHREAPVELRERMTLSPDRLKSLLAGPGPAKAGSGLAVLSEIAVLSTCNRLEVYAVSGGESFQDLIRFASEAPPGCRRKSFLGGAPKEREAVVHLSA